MKSGFVAVVGRPNVGKSTLINALVGKKVSIVSNKPQTTRYRIRAVLNREQGQIVFVDTPGYHKPRDALGEYLNDAVEQTFNDVDLILFLVDAASGVGRGDEYLASIIKDSKPPKILAINKIDACTETEKKRAEELAKNLLPFDRVISISAVTGENLDELVNILFELLPEGPRYYPEDMITDNPVEQQIAEIIREKVLERTFEEVPHAVAVEVEEIEEESEKNLLKIHAVIYVEKESQKGIIIGKNGSMIKDIGTAARLELEALLNKKVFLSLHVKVKKNWRKKENAIRLLY